MALLIQTLKFGLWPLCCFPWLFKFVHYYSECGYVATPITMVQAALTLLNEPSALPNE